MEKGFDAITENGFTPSMNKNETADKLNRSLWSACMGNMSLANSWLTQAAEFIRGHSMASEEKFVGAAHVSNRRKATAAYRLAMAQGNMPGGEMPA